MAVSIKGFAMPGKQIHPDSANRPAEEELLDLNFVPKWAKKEPSVNHYRRAEDRSPRTDRRDRPRRDRPDRSRRESRTGRREQGPRPDRPPRGPRAPRVDLPVEIKFLPDQKALGSMVRQIHHSKRAYPLMDLAGLFLSDPKKHQVKIEVKPDPGDFRLYQGKRSRIVATDRDVLLRQILDDHLEDFFSKEDVEMEPPSGTFPMVGKIDHILIGPPNHHSYAERLAEIHRTRYAGMPFDRFKQKVETVRDEEQVEQWRQEASKKTVYRLKEAPEGESRDYTLVQAEEYVRTHIADTEIETVERAVLPAERARALRDADLMRMIQQSFHRETRFPRTLSFALRAAFRHLHLHTFKAGGNINFVTAVKPDPIAPDAAVETIREVLEFLAEHPGSNRQQLVEGLRPGAAIDSPEAHEILNPIRWLVEKGHLIEFFNGTFSVPSRRRPGRTA